MNAPLHHYKWNLLIAEDDDDDYFIFEMALQETNCLYKSVRAENGEILLSILKEHIPDILFIDIQMPCKDGHQCIKEIRADRRYDELPIIVYSSRSDLANIERCYRAGSNFFVIKPDRLNDLTSVLRHLLSNDWRSHLYFPSESDFVLRANHIN